MANLSSALSKSEEEIVEEKIERMMRQMVLEILLVGLVLAAFAGYEYSDIVPKLELAAGGSLPLLRQGLGLAALFGSLTAVFGGVLSSRRSLLAVRKD